jgi:hypothetical protein
MPGSLASTLATHLAMRHVVAALDQSRPAVRITDPYLPSDVEEALAPVGYVSAQNQWAKLALRAVGAAEALAADLGRLATEAGVGHAGREVARSLRAAGESRDRMALAALERVLWPAKFVDLEIPAYIVPVRPAWAQHLLGEEPQQPSLFGTDPELALSWENAYYRASTPGVMAPARVLWYVSQPRMQIRACSWVEEVVVDTPKEVFRRFRRLGVYRWRDVLGVAGGCAGKPIMALRFGRTELLDSPIGWPELQEVLEAAEGKRSQIQTVTRISMACFLRLYGLGKARA